jgi:DNA-directed RNA polymerase delta subunit
MAEEKVEELDDEAKAKLKKGKKKEKKKSRKDGDDDLNNDLMNEEPEVAERRRINELRELREIANRYPDPNLKIVFA